MGIPPFMETLICLFPVLCVETCLVVFLAAECMLDERRGDQISWHFHLLTFMVFLMVFLRRPIVLKQCEFGNMCQFDQLPLVWCVFFLREILAQSFPLLCTCLSQTFCRSVPVSSNLCWSPSQATWRLTLRSWRFCGATWFEFSAEYGDSSSFCSTSCLDPVFFPSHSGHPFAIHLSGIFYENRGPQDAWLNSILSTQVWNNSGLAAVESSRFPSGPVFTRSSWKTDALWRWAWLLDWLWTPFGHLWLDFHVVRRSSSTKSSTPTKTSPPRRPDLRQSHYFYSTAWCSHRSIPVQMMKYGTTC